MLSLFSVAYECGIDLQFVNRITVHEVDGNLIDTTEFYAAPDQTFDDDSRILEGDLNPDALLEPPFIVTWLNDKNYEGSTLVTVDDNGEVVYG